VTKTRKAGREVVSYPDQYPFELELEFVVGCKDVVKFFHNHHIPKAQLQGLQQAVGARALVRAAPTRWGTIQAMCLSLLESERHLHAIVTARDFVQGTVAQKSERMKVREVVTDKDFIESLKKALAILEPLDKLIVKYQSDKVPISDVMHDFHTLPDAFMKIFAANIINRQQLDYLVMLSRRRFQFMYGVAHGLSYMLDPRYIGQGLPADLRASLDEALINKPADEVTTINDDRKEKLFMQYTAFFISATKEKQANSFRYQMLAKGRKTPFQYWFADGCQWPVLQSVAVKLFSMATSSAASERNFSAMGFIHSKLRKSLSPKTVEKLVFIKSNLPAFCENEAGDDNDYQSDFQSDDSVP
jgi:hAT family C-terminal dimerisation region